MRRTVLSPRNAGLPLVLLIAGCIEPEVSPRAPSHDPANLPYGEHPADDDLGEDPHMLALARQHPSFAGMFFEPGTDRLVVASTSTDAREAAALRQTVLTAVATELGRPQTAADGGLALNAVHRTFEYSFLELARYRARIRPEVFGIPGVQSLSVDEQHNRIKVGLLDPSARDRVEQLAIDLAIPIQMLSFAHESPVQQLYGTSRSTRSRTRISSEPTLQDVISVPDDRLRGGYMIQAEHTQGPCTLGFTAAVMRKNPTVQLADTYFVAASHCSWHPFFLDSGYWNQPDNERGPEREDPGHDYFPRGVGQEVKDKLAYPCRIGGKWQTCHSDASLVQTYYIPDYTLPGDEHQTPRLIALGEIGRTKKRSNCGLCPDPVIAVDTVNPVIHIVSTKSNIVVGDTLDKVGQTTGWTYGTVLDTCIDFNTQRNDVHIRCAIEAYVTHGGGDSGAPFFEYDTTSGTASLVGTLVGSRVIDTHANRARIGIISKLRQIKIDFGFLTNLDDLLVCYAKRC